MGQSSARWRVLGRVNEPRTVASIAREVGYARQSVQRVADVLAGEGLARYLEHPTDGRTKLLELTPQGLEVLNALYQRQLAWSQRVLTLLDPELLRAATASLGAIGRVLDSVVHEETPHDSGPEAGGPTHEPNRQHSKEGER